MATVWFKPALEKKKPKKRFSKSTPSRRLEEMSQPIKVFEPIDYEAPFRIKRSALHYRCTQRIDRLAEPLERHYWVPNEPEPTTWSYTKVPKRALRAKSTPRIRQLAQPKNTKPYLEARLKVLKEKVSKSIIELLGPATKPRHRRQSKKRRSFKRSKFELPKIFHNVV